MWVWSILAAVVAWFIYLRLTQVSGDEAKAVVERGAMLIDVRSRPEYESGHLPGAINIPLPDLQSRLSELGPTDAPKVVYCLAGTRSVAARGVLKRGGFTQVLNLGSMSRWPK